MMKEGLRRGLFFGLIVLVVAWPTISSGAALILGLLFGLSLGNPFLAKSKVWTPKLLSYAVIGLGAGMNLNVALKVGLSGFASTAIGISFTLGLGFLLGKWLGQNLRVSALVSVGTAICGGSAIASVAPVVGAKDEEISLALGIVFLLNALALFLFPAIGHLLHLSESQFGVWAALAIHDTSSVVGATLAYGDQALQIGTTVKLARALWIVPVTLGIGWIWARWKLSDRDGQSDAPRKYPWFILGFLLMAAIYTWVPAVHDAFRSIEWIAKRLMVLTLFLIGANLNRKLLQGMGLRPVLQGVLLWIIVAGLTLVALLQGWIPISVS